MNIETEDGLIKNVHIEVIKVSQTLKKILEGTFKLQTLEVPCIKTKTLEKVFQWCEYHLHDPVDPSFELSDDDISSWDLKFLDVELDKLCELINAANYLDIKRLVNICSVKIANMIRGKEPEEVRKMFALQEQMKDLEKVAREVSWINI